MTRKKILKQVYQKDMCPEEAYQKLYSNTMKLKKTRFVKMKMKFKESKGLTLFFRFFFFLPCPIVIAKMIMKKRMKDDFELWNMLLYSRGAKIEVKSEELEMKIKLL